MLDAYCVYCKGLGQCEEALELWRAAASLLPRVPITDTHVSLRPGTRAMERFKMDSTFPRNRTRVFAISDIHIDQHGNVGWVKGLSEENFKNDVVMIAGDVGDTMVSPKKRSHALLQLQNADPARTPHQERAQDLPQGVQEAVQASLLLPRQP